MTRRQLLALAASVLPLGCKPAAPLAIRGPRKKGLCLTTKKRSPEKVAGFLESVGAHWVYNWDIDPLENLPAGVEFIPMIYKRPIWITEFAVADWKAKSPAENRYKPETVADFVAKLLPQLEAMDIVERYAWFHGGVSGSALASSKLFNADGSLTIVGEAYRSAG